MALKTTKILAQKAGVSLLVFLVPLAVLSTGILLIESFLSK